VPYEEEAQAAEEAVQEMQEEKPVPVEANEVFKGISDGAHLELPHRQA